VPLTEVYRGASYVALTDASLSDDPPSEFRILRAGLNATSKGDLEFDAAAAASVMAAYKKSGVDMMIDLAHDSISEEARANRTDADDARGWFRLELRDGELWATDVRWTPDGTRRLREKTQRYISPVVLFDDGRITEILNVALCSMPATYNAAPLVAASKSLEMYAMDPKLIMQALDAIETGDEALAKQLLKQMVAAAAGAEGGEEAPAEEPQEPSEEMADTEEEEDTDEKAMAVALRRFTGRNSALEAERVLVALRAENKALRKRDAELTFSARRELVGDLVKFGAELPATAWEDAENGVPVERLRNESLDSLRTRVEAFRSVRKAQTKAPTSAASGLSDIEERYTKDLTPAQRDRYIELRAQRKGTA